mmetsp:Transcript_14864/g.24595  ORF Transcript_14864/g.24595 Transcript_14864/m.24595 type:complete len:116 (-) Transcript_14864:51-398(-)
MKFVLFLLLCQLMFCVGAKNPTTCDDPCVGGACLFRNCEQSASCRGGACTFIHCFRPVCQGGGCHFDACKEPKCPGGGCDFFNTQETLKPGYCDGESCKLDGQPHPPMREGHVSL